MTGPMTGDDRNILNVLQFELNFLEKGGYSRSPREPWHAPLVFEDSPTCMNYDSKENPRPCAECLLMQFVPPELRETKIPCLHIQLTPAGDSLESLYRWADQHEVEDAMRSWLRSAIAQLESQSPAPTPAPAK